MSASTLYELTGFQLDIERVIENYEKWLNENPDTDATLKDVLDELYQELIANAEAEEAKLEAICKRIRHYELCAQMKRLEIERLSKAATADDFNVKRLKNLIEMHLTATGQTKAPAGLFKVWLQANGGATPLEWADGWEKPTEDQILEIQESRPEFTQTKVSLVTPEIRKALEDGESLDFVRLGQRGQSLRIK